MFGLFKPLLVFFGIEIFIFSTVPGGKTRVKKLEEIARWTLERIPATAPNTRLDMRRQELQNAERRLRRVSDGLQCGTVDVKNSSVHFICHNSSKSFNFQDAAKLAEEFVQRHSKLLIKYRPLSQR